MNYNSYIDFNSWDLTINRFLEYRYLLKDFDKLIECYNKLDRNRLITKEEFIEFIDQLRNFLNKNIELIDYEELLSIKHDFYWVYEWLINMSYIIII